MNLFKPVLSVEPFYSGCHYIKAKIAGEYPSDSSTHKTRYEFTQKAFLAALRKIIAEDSLFKVLDEPKVHMQTIEKYSYQAALLEIADDDWQGVVIQSKDRVLLEAILGKLKLLA